MNTALLKASQAWSLLMRTLRGTLALVGLAALTALIALPVQREALLKHLPPLAAIGLADPFAQAATTAAGSIQAQVAESGIEREQRLVAGFIAKRYRVADEAVSSFVATAYHAGSAHSVDPLLILAVMAIESRYNPVAESSMGAKGLMQIIPKYHLEKLSDHGGEHALLDPEINILVGAQILREYTRRFGSLEVALQAYGGAYDEPTAQYANKVFAERARLEPVRQTARKQTAQSA